jgi:hypothetical protein
MIGRGMEKEKRYNMKAASGFREANSFTVHHAIRTLALQILQKHNLGTLNLLVSYICISISIPPFSSCSNKKLPLVQLSK